MRSASAWPEQEMPWASATLPSTSRQRASVCGSCILKLQQEKVSPTRASEGVSIPSLANILQGRRKPLCFRIRAALIDSLAQTQVRTRSSPRTHAGKGASPPPKEVALPKNRSICVRTLYSPVRIRVASGRCCAVDANFGSVFHCRDFSPCEREPPVDTPAPRHGRTSNWHRIRHLPTGNLLVQLPDQAIGNFLFGGLQRGDFPCFRQHFRGPNRMQLITFRQTASSASPWASGSLLLPPMGNGLPSIKATKAGLPLPRRNFWRACQNRPVPTLSMRLLIVAAEGIAGVSIGSCSSGRVCRPN